ncbi:hypothetical protein KP509_13G071400 [Ceratopteris richardii]|nr:hypothetical protein KP509_13G071400 [Ceratopteris richardii]
MSELAIEIMGKDEERIKALVQRNHLAHDVERFLATSSASSTFSETTSAVSYGVGNYIANIGIGTPTEWFLLVLDTGSDLTWTQCVPCETADSCYSQANPIFDPSSSASYTPIGCIRGCPACSTSGLCQYEQHYADNSGVRGDFAYETFTIGDARIQEYIFGCGRANQGTFEGVDGLLGLGWGPLGMPSQTVSSFEGAFTYCLPSFLASYTSTGFIELGKGISEAASEGVLHTAMIKNTDLQSFYFVWLQGISVGSVPLALSSTSFSRPNSAAIAGTMTDCGTVITRLPAADYVTFRDAFIAGSSDIELFRTSDFLDTCFRFNRKSQIPTVRFHFDGIDLSLPVENTVFPLSSNTACLAFAPMTFSWLQDVTIIGNYQMQGFLFTFDTVGSTMGIQTAAKVC